jgi:hypothetical protein
MTVPDQLFATNAQQLKASKEQCKSTDTTTTWFVHPILGLQQGPWNHIYFCEGVRYNKVMANRTRRRIETLQQLGAQKLQQVIVMKKYSFV